MIEKIGPYVMQSVTGLSPILLTCIIGFIFGVVLFERSRSASILMILGTVIHLLSYLALIIVQGYLITHRDEWHWNFEQFGQWMSTIGTIGNLGKAAGLALIIAAAFVGRGRATAEPEEFAVRS
jgi:hypothetical protein